MLSGLAGALSQKGLQLTGMSGRDPFLYTMENIILFCRVVLVANMLRGGSPKSPDDKKIHVTTSPIRWSVALIPIIFKAAGGARHGSGPQVCRLRRQRFCSFVWIGLEWRIAVTSPE
jgi:hypothetical protein